jgi:hypothetical protein
MSGFEADYSPFSAMANKPNSVLTNVIIRSIRKTTVAVEKPY